MRKNEIPEITVNGVVYVPKSSGLSPLCETACSVEFLLHGLLEHFYVDCSGELHWSYNEGYAVDDVDADLAKHLKAWREANEVKDAVD